MKKINKRFEVFIAGENIDLVIPNINAVNKDNWHSWFNDNQINNYLANHGLFPNTRESQLVILKKMIKNNREKKNLFLNIKPKKKNFIIGITSLSKIDYLNSYAELSIIIKKNSYKNNFLFGYEVKALMTEHAFEKFNLQTIRSSQVISLKHWQNNTQLLGYMPEGIQKKKLTRNNKTYDVATQSCSLENYLKIKKLYNGNYWPGNKNFFKLISKLPKKNIYDELENKLRLIEKNQFKLIKKIYDKIS